MPDVKSSGPVPHRRFPEFRDAGPWEVKRLGEVCSTFSGGTPNSSRKDFYGGTIPFIRSAEIDQESTELFITENGLINSSAKLIKKGDLLIALYGANSGDASIAKLDGAINQAILCLRSTFDLRFILNYWLLRKEPIIQKYIQGGQGNLSGDIVKSIEFAFPTITEQQKIADCLSSLDDLIRAEEAALEALNEHKKGLMQQLFPREGETTPRLRFPEFRDAGPWEVKRLGEIADCYQPETISVSSTSGDGEFPVFGANGIIGYFDRYNHEQPEVIVGCRGQCGNVFLTPPKSWITGNSMVIHVQDDQEIDKNFLFNSLTSSDLSYLITGSAQPQITGEIKRHKVSLPSLPEQQKIADCLSSLDDLIRAVEGQLAALNDHKKGLMQQLFPREGETTPRRRFPEFRDAGPWEVKRLGDVADCYQPETISVSSTSENGKYPVYGANGIIGYFERYNHEDPEVIVGCRGQCGSVFLTPPKSWITGNSMVIHNKRDQVSSKKFLFYSLTSSDLSYLITGSAQPQITGEIKRHRVLLPSPLEQQKIADCLSSLDDLIRAQGDKIAALKQHKKGLMQHLFPQEVG